jgi:hypothetical protein
MIIKILAKYSGFRNYWYENIKEKTIYINSDIKEKLSIGCAEKELELLNKWNAYIIMGHYGFSLGSPCPFEWYDIINEFLEYFIELQETNKIKAFGIEQIKIKYGSIRWYTSWITDDEELDEFLRLQIKYLENHLHDDKLIY